MAGCLVVKVKAIWRSNKVWRQVDKYLDAVLLYFCLNEGEAENEVSMLHYFIVFEMLPVLHVRAS